MAELADIGMGYYGQLEVGTSQMSLDTLIKLSRAMHLPMEYIVLGEGCLLYTSRVAGRAVCRGSANAGNRALRAVQGAGRRIMR